MLRAEKKGNTKYEKSGKSLYDTWKMMESFQRYSLSWRAKFGRRACARVYSSWSAWAFCMPRGQRRTMVVCPPPTASGYKIQHPVKSRSHPFSSTWWVSNGTFFLSIYAFPHDRKSVSVRRSVRRSVCASHQEHETLPHAKLFRDRCKLITRTHLVSEHFQPYRADVGGSWRLYS